MNQIKRFIKGIHDITPVQQLEAKMYGHIGGVIGLIFAGITLAMYKTWYFTLFLIFVIFLQYLEFIGTRQKWKQIIEINKSMESNKEDLMKIMEESK